MDERSFELLVVSDPEEDIDCDRWIDDVDMMLPRTDCGSVSGLLGMDCVVVACVERSLSRGGPCS